MTFSFTTMGSHESIKETETIRGRQHSCRIRTVLLLVLLVASSNLLTLYVFRGPLTTSLDDYSIRRLIISPTSELLWELNLTRHNLLATESELHNVRDQLHTSTRLTQTLIDQMPLFTDLLATNNRQGVMEVPEELKEIIAGHKLPLGHSRLFNTDTIYAPMGHPCMMMKEELGKYMEYEAGRQCPDDDHLAQTLMLRGCEPLPRRRCFSPTPGNYTEPFPFPQSMWAAPPDSNIVWTPYTCKSYACLNDRKNHKNVWADCKDCFDLDGREKWRWLNSNDPLHFGIDQVLELKKGSIRIGLDIGGGTATFAVRMRERNVTIVTTSMNLDGPFNNFIASRGMVPLFMTISQRLPFFDNTLDLVHSMHVLSNWIPTTLLELVLYDIYRVLRPGGVFWLDHFFCVESQLREVYVPMIERLGYKKVKWHEGRKLDRGAQFKEMYLSALLEKPLSMSM